MPAYRSLLLMAHWLEGESGSYLPVSGSESEGLYCINRHKPPILLPDRLVLWVLWDLLLLWLPPGRLVLWVL